MEKKLIFHRTDFGAALLLNEVPAKKWVRVNRNGRDANREPVVALSKSDLEVGRMLRVCMHVP